jgi:hypothetical protein
MGDGIDRPTGVCSSAPLVGGRCGIRTVELPPPLPGLTRVARRARKRFEIQAGITNALSFGLLLSLSCGVERGHLLDDGGLNKVSTDSTDDDSLILSVSIRIPSWA